MSKRSNLSVPTQQRGLFRGAALLVALLLACQATWILAAELSRPELEGFPVNAQAAATIAANRNAATKAAEFGLFRGDLWADCAVTYLDVSWPDAQHDQHDQDNVELIEQGYRAAYRAATRSPHDARIWLVLASIDLHYGWLNQPAAAAALRMSYYTGANRVELIPLRLHLVVHSEALDDKDLQELVRHDIGVIISRKPELKPAILSAYAEAQPTGRQFLEEAVKELDPSLFAELQPTG